MEEVKYYSFLLHLDFDSLIDEANKVVEEKNFDKFKKIDKLVTNYFSKIIVEFNKEKLVNFISKINDFAIDFFWDDKPKFEDVKEIVSQWGSYLKIANMLKNVNNISDIIKNIKKSSFNVKILGFLANNKYLQSKDLADKLEIEQNQMCNNTIILEKYNLIGRERTGKNSYYFITPYGRKIFNEYFAENNSIVELIFEIANLFKEGDKNKIDIVEDKINQIILFSDDDRKKMRNIINGVLNNKKFEKYSQDKEKFAKKGNFDDHFSKNGTSW